MNRALSYPAPQLLAKHSPTHGRREDCDRGTLWTDAEVAWLIKNYALLSIDVCASRLRRSANAVRAKAMTMGLSPVPPEDVLAKMIDAGRARMRQLANEISSEAAAE